MTVTYKDRDPATDILLDFIAGGVPTNELGESAGNYNAVFGKIDATEVLAEKNLTEIYAMQDQMVADNGISSATGRYQALKSTLQEYQNHNNLPDTTMFAEMIQDDFGLVKMMDRGYDDWKEQEIDDDEFMHRLSCEWASLPDPYNGGKSHYDGDSAGNHASTTLDAFHDVLEEARKHVDKPLGASMEATQGIRDIQQVLVGTGDLNAGDVDGIWGPQSEQALNNLIDRA